MLLKQMVATVACDLCRRRSLATMCVIPSYFETVAVSLSPLADMASLSPPAYLGGLFRAWRQPLDLLDNASLSYSSPPSSGQFEKAQRV